MNNWAHCVTKLKIPARNPYKPGDVAAAQFTSLILFFLSVFFFHVITASALGTDSLQSDNSLDTTFFDDHHELTKTKSVFFQQKEKK